MYLKSVTIKNFPNKSPISCVDWSSNDEIYTISDNLKIYKTNSSTQETIEIAKLPNDFFPTDLHWLIGKNNNNKGSTDSLLITSNDGRFIILNKSARVERNISAHTMSITSGRWSPDGTSLFTASEDGVLKIWSRSGMLRSTVIQSEEAIRCARWSSQSSAIVFCQGNTISLKSLTANSRIIKWRAHDGLVLCLSWSPITKLIASGGEDFRYKIWDSHGTNIFTSTTDNYTITAIDFSPSQDFLAVGGFNVLKLCNNNGWSYSNSRFNSPPHGSIYNISWSPDGTQIACGTSSGNVVLSHIIKKQLISGKLKATTTGNKSILLQNISNGVKDIIDFHDRIITFSLGYGHLIVATSQQIHIFNENYMNTPIIIDGRIDVRIIEIAKKFFIVIDWSTIWIYTYTGRLHLNPRYPGSQVQIANLTSKCISIGLDFLSVRDNSEQNMIHVFDLLPGATRQTEPNTISTKHNIIELATCRSGILEDQYLAFIDENHELFVTSLAHGNRASHYKIGTQVITIKWASETNILVGLHDSCYSIWYCPGEACLDPTLIALTTVTTDSTEFGKNLSLESFDDFLISFRTSGALFSVNINIYCELMHRSLMQAQWKKALKICRIANNVILWATLAAIATKKNQFAISEESYSAVLHIDKVRYLQYIKNLPQSTPQQMAENSLVLGRLIEAETILIHNKLFKDAIMLCIRMHRWKRAFEIADKYNTEMDETLKERKKYLEALGKDEQDINFMKFLK